MTQQNHPHTTTEKLIDAYNRMMDRVKTAIEEGEKGAAPRLHHAVEKAKEMATQLGELTREEAEKIGDYLKRDIEDAANYLAGPKGQEIADWLRFDIEQAENRMLDSFLSVADQTKVDLLRLEQEAAFANTYRTGEVTGIGTLACTECGKRYHFHKTGHIPPCAQCNNTVFTRAPE